MVAVGVSSCHLPPEGVVASGAAELRAPMMTISGGQRQIIQVGGRKCQRSFGSSSMQRAVRTEFSGVTVITYSLHK